MNVDQIAAFNLASGTTTGELQSFILTFLFVSVCLWAVIMFFGKISVFKKGGDIDASHVVSVSLRVLTVVVVVLFLVNI